MRVCIYTAIRISQNAHTYNMITFILKYWHHIQDSISILCKDNPATFLLCIFYTQPILLFCRFSYNIPILFMSQLIQVLYTTLTITFHHQAGVIYCCQAYLVCLMISLVLKIFSMLSVYISQWFIISISVLNIEFFPLLNRAVRRHLRQVYKSHG